MDVNGDGFVDLGDFSKRHGEVAAIAGGSFARRPDQRPMFEFVRGEPAGAEGLE